MCEISLHYATLINLMNIKIVVVEIKCFKFSVTSHVHMFKGLYEFMDRSTLH